jgi:hypothetical protein
MHRLGFRENFPKSRRFLPFPLTSSFQIRQNSSPPYYLCSAKVLLPELGSCEVTVSRCHLLRSNSCVRRRLVSYPVIAPLSLFFRGSFCHFLGFGLSVLHLVLECSSQCSSRPSSFFSGILLQFTSTMDFDGCKFSNSSSSSPSSSSFSSFEFWSESGDQPQPLPRAFSPLFCW